MSQGRNRSKDKKDALKSRQSDRRSKDKGKDNAEKENDSALSAKTKRRINIESGKMQQQGANSQILNDINDDNEGEEKGKEGGQHEHILKSKKMRDLGVIKESYYDYEIPGNQEYKKSPLYRGRPKMGPGVIWQLRGRAKKYAYLFTHGAEPDYFELPERSEQELAHANQDYILDSDGGYHEVNYVNAEYDRVVEQILKYKLKVVGENDASLAAWSGCTRRTYEEIYGRKFNKNKLESLRIHETIPEMIVAMQGEAVIGPYIAARQDYFDRVVGYGEHGNECLFTHLSKETQKWPQLREDDEIFNDYRKKIETLGFKIISGSTRLQHQWQGFLYYGFAIQVSSAYPQPYALEHTRGAQAQRQPQHRRQSSLSNPDAQYTGFTQFSSNLSSKQQKMIIYEKAKRKSMQATITGFTNFDDGTTEKVQRPSKDQSTKPLISASPVEANALEDNLVQQNDNYDSIGQQGNPNLNTKVRAGVSIIGGFGARLRGRSGTRIRGRGGRLRTAYSRGYSQHGSYDTNKYSQKARNYTSARQQREEKKQDNDEQNQDSRQLIAAEIRKRGEWSDLSTEWEKRFRRNQEIKTDYIITNLKSLDLQVGNAYPYYNWNKYQQEAEILIKIDDVFPHSDLVVSDFLNSLTMFKCGKAKYVQGMIKNISIQIKENIRRYTNTGQKYYKTIQTIYINLNMVEMKKFVHLIDIKDEYDRELPSADILVRWIRGFTDQVNHNEIYRLVLENYFGPTCDIYVANRYSPHKIRFDIKNIDEQIVVDSDNNAHDVNFINIKTALINEVGLCPYTEFELSREYGQSSEAYGSMIRLKLTEHAFENNGVISKIYDSDYQRLDLPVQNHIIHADEYIHNQRRRGKLYEKRRKMDLKEQQKKNANSITIWKRGGGTAYLDVISNDDWKDDGTMQLANDPYASNKNEEWIQKHHNDSQIDQMKRMRSGDLNEENMRKELNDGIGVNYGNLASMNKLKILNDIADTKVLNPEQDLSGVQASVSGLEPQHRQNKKYKEKQTMNDDISLPHSEKKQTDMNDDPFLG